MYAPKKHHQTKAVANVIQEGERHHPKWAAELDNISHVVLNWQHWLCGSELAAWWLCGSEWVALSLWF